MFGSPCYLSGIIETLTPYAPWLWLVLALVLFMVFFRPILQLLGVVIIPENNIGLVTKKFVLDRRAQGAPQRPDHRHPGRGGLSGADAGSRPLFLEMDLAV